MQQTVIGKREKSTLESKLKMNTGHMHRPAESSDVPLTSNELQCEHINSIYNLLILGDYKFLLIKVEFLCIKVSQVVL